MIQARVGDAQKVMDSRSPQMSCRSEGGTERRQVERGSDPCGDSRSLCLRDGRFSG